MSLWYIIYPIVALILSSVWVWALIDSLKKHRPWAWIAILAFIPILSAPVYFLNFYFIGSDKEGALDSTLKLSGRIRSLKTKVEQDGLVGDKRELADAFFDNQNYREALILLRDVLHYDGTDLRSQYQAGVSQIAIGQPDQALAHLEYVLDEEPRFYQGDARLAYANALMALGDKEKARREFERTTSHFNIPESTVQAARFLIEDGDKEQAYKMLLTMLQTVQLTDRQKRTQKIWIKRAADELQKLKRKQ
ncbi:MAG: tetratricopeptide repeat protein [Sumerlaeia bacterium]